VVADDDAADTFGPAVRVEGLSPPVSVQRTSRSVMDRTHVVLLFDVLALTSLRSSPRCQMPPGSRIVSRAATNLSATVLENIVMNSP